MNAITNRLTPENYQKGYVTFPLDENRFKEFITSLLGKPQTITKRISGTFELHLKDLQNFNDLICQRVQQQNRGKLLQLISTLYFDDNSSVILGSLDELISYSEIKPITPIAIRMIWSFLITFPDKAYPEKQEIEIMTVSNPLKNISDYDNISFFSIGGGEFTILIRHTARSWGADMESLLTNHINSLLTRPSSWKNKIYKNKFKIGLAFALVFVLASLIGIFWATKKFTIIELSRVHSFIDKPGTSLESRTNYLISYIAANKRAQFENAIQIFFVISLFLSSLFAILITSFANNRPRSYLILTREAVKQKGIIDKKQKSRWIMFTASIIIGIISKVAAYYILSWLAG